MSTFEQICNGLVECIEADPNHRAVVKGSRILVAQVLVELADGHSLGKIAADYSLDLRILKRILEVLAQVLSLPVESA